MERKPRAPAFAASLVDFYGRVAATENGVACRIEPAAVPAAGDFSAGTAAAEDAAVADALELGGALEASSEGGLVVFDGVVPRGRLGSTYEARIACADRAPASSAASDVVSQNAARNASDAEDVVAIAPVTFPVRIATCARGESPRARSEAGSCEKKDVAACAPGAALNFPPSQEQSPHPKRLHFDLPAPTAGNNSWGR